MTYIFKAPQARLIREGNGNPLRYPCLENPRDRGAWRGTVCEVTESDRTERLIHTYIHTYTHTHTHTQDTQTVCKLQVKSSVIEFLVLQFSALEKLKLVHILWDQIRKHVDLGFVNWQLSGFEEVNS